MNLALRDVRRHFARFSGTGAGLGLLVTVVVAMQGIYAGMVDDAVLLTRVARADLWVVQRDTRGPFAEASRLDPSVEARAAAVPGVTSARPYTYQVLQRERRGEVLRIALVGLGWPDDRGQDLPVVRGRTLEQAHGELVADASLGLALGEAIVLAGEPYRVVGLTRNTLTSGGDAVAFLTVSDALAVAADTPAEAVLLERQRTIERLRRTDLGRSQTALEDLVIDPRWRAPALASSPLAAVLLRVEPHRLEEVRSTLAAWGDVAVFTQAEEQQLLLGGVVQRARMQIGLFTVILTLTAAVVVMMVIYQLTLEKTHDLAILKLLGLPRARLLAIVLQQAWLLGLLVWLVASLLGSQVYPHFPRRVLMTDTILLATPAVVFVVVTLASALALLHVERIDPAQALEG